MKNGPKVIIAVICLLVAAGVLLFQMGIIGGSSASSANGTNATNAGATTAPIDTSKAENSDTQAGLDKLPTPRNKR